MSIQLIAPRRPAPLAFGLLSLLLLAAQTLAEGLPRIRVDQVKQLESGNVGETFLGRSQGRRWFFKGDAAVRDIQRYGNFEAEVLTAKIFRRLGVLAPQARVVEIEGRRGAYLQTELVDPTFTGGTKPLELKAWLQQGNKDHGVDLREVRILQMVDVLTGNGDRHDANLFMSRMGDGETLVVPIDHNLGFATPSVVVGYYNWHLTRGLQGVVPHAEPGDSGDLLYPNHAPRSGTPQRILLRNPLYKKAWKLGGRDRGVLAEYVQIAEYLRRRLTDDFLNRILADLPDAFITHGDPRARKAEILELVKSRRDRLPDWMREQAQRADPRARKGLAWMRAHVPAPLLDRLSLNQRQWTFLGLHLFEGSAFEPAAAYSYLRATAVEALSAREVVGHLARAAGLEFAPASLERAEDQLEGSAYQGAFERFYSDDRMQAREPHRRDGTDASGRPLRLIEALGESQKLMLTDARGAPVSVRRARPMRRALKRALQQCRLRPGERLLLEYDAFASGPDRAVYAATALDSSGKARWTGVTGGATPIAD